MAVADFEGIAIHCAQNSVVCGRSPKARPDVLTDEPGGYDGFLALYGNKYVAPAINNGLPYVLDLDGNHIADSSTPPNDGFPGFDPLSAASRNSSTASKAGAASSGSSPGSKSARKGPMRISNVMVAKDQLTT